MVGHAPAWAASWAARPLTCAGSVQAFPRRQSIEGEFRDLIERWPWATCRLTSDFSVPDEPRQQGHSRSADESPKAPLAWRYAPAARWRADLDWGQCRSAKLASNDVAGVRQVIEMLFAY
jgi:hypothetical protein